jgi:hypothetical protein
MRFPRRLLPTHSYGHSLPDNPVHLRDYPNTVPPSSQYDTAIARETLARLAAPATPEAAQGERQENAADRQELFGFRQMVDR